MSSKSGQSMPGALMIPRYLVRTPPSPQATLQADQSDHSDSVHHSSTNHRACRRAYRRAVQRVVRIQRPLIDQGRGKRHLSDTQKEMFRENQAVTGSPQRAPAQSEVEQDCVSASALQLAACDGTGWRVRVRTHSLFATVQGEKEDQVM